MSNLRRRIMMMGDYVILPYIESNPDICIRPDIEIDLSQTDYEFGGEGFYYAARDTDRFVSCFRSGYLAPRWVFCRNNLPSTPVYLYDIYVAACSAEIQDTSHSNIPVTFVDFSFVLTAGRIHVKTAAGSYNKSVNIVTAQTTAPVIYALGSYLRIKSTYIKKGGAFISKCIPVMRKSDSANGLFDIVRNKFYPFENR